MYSSWRTDDHLPTFAAASVPHCRQSAFRPQLPFTKSERGNCLAVTLMVRDPSNMIKDPCASPPSRYELSVSPLLTSLAAALLLLFCSAALAENTAVLVARVSKVLDGDTFTLSGEPRRIRVWGLDAPEWNHRGGSTATASLRGLISGKRLRCAVLDMDRYGRLVAQCFLADGRDIAAEMIRSGSATEFCRYSRGYYGTC
jgi:micrococcal nuclease